MKTPFHLASHFILFFLILMCISSCNKFLQAAYASLVFIMGQVMNHDFTLGR